MVRAFIASARSPPSLMLPRCPPRLDLFGTDPGQCRSLWPLATRPPHIVSHEACMPRPPLLVLPMKHGLDEPARSGPPHGLTLHLTWGLGNRGWGAESTCSMSPRCAPPSPAPHGTPCRDLCPRWTSHAREPPTWWSSTCGSCSRATRPRSSRQPRFGIRIGVTLNQRAARAPPRPQPSSLPHEVARHEPSPDALTTTSSRERSVASRDAASAASPAVSGESPSQLPRRRPVSLD